jgi:hypothetical protein
VAEPWVAKANKTVRPARGDGEVGRAVLRPVGAAHGISPAHPGFRLRLQPGQLSGGATRLWGSKSTAGEGFGCGCRDRKKSGLARAVHARLAHNQQRFPPRVPVPAFFHGFQPPNSRSVGNRATLWAVAQQAWRMARVVAKSGFAFPRGSGQSPDLPISPGQPVRPWGSRPPCGRVVSKELPSPSTSFESDFVMRGCRAD